MNAELTTTVVDAPAASGDTDFEGPVSDEALCLYWTTKPGAAHVPLLRTEIEMVAGEPAIGWDGLMLMPVTERSAQGVACAEAWGAQIKPSPTTASNSRRKPFMRSIR